ncbi:MAG: glycosyltransferase [Candidatus Omnitrophica bacterium]|nr:glycosyltransferase [Candidatus Omnitrophota bacterium]
MKNPIKVVYVITGLFVGGAERLLLNTVRALDQQQFEPIVVSLVGGGLIPEFQKSGIRTVNIKMSRLWPLPGAWRLFRFLRAEKPGIVHTHLIHADFFGRVLGRLSGVPINITTLHMVEDARRKFPYLAINRFAVRFNTALIAVSDSIKKEIVALERIDPEMVTVIRNAARDWDRVPAGKARDLRVRFGIKPDALLLGIVSRLEVPRKGHHVLFKALARLISRYPELHCVVIGDGAENEKEKLHAQVRELGVAEHVTFTGTQNNISEWLAAIDIFVLPSLLEGFPMAIIEAMAAARPIIATRVGGVGELIGHKREGWLIEPGEVSGLAEAIEVLALDPDLRCRLGQVARQRFEQNFEISKAVEATQNLYNRQIQQYGVSRRVHLLEVITNFDPGGVPRHVEDLVVHLSKDKFDIGLVSGETLEERIPRVCVPHYYVNMVKPINPLKDLCGIWDMVKLFKKLKPDIVHAHMGKAVCLASIAARFSGVPCVLATIHGRTLLTKGFSIKQFIFDLVEKITLRLFVHGTISVSKDTARYLISASKVLPSRSVTIYNGVIPIKPSLPDRDKARQKLRIRRSEKVILMTGRLVFQKTPEVLIEACTQLRRQFPDLVCLIAGDGPKYQALAQFIEELGLKGIVQLLGHRDDIPELLSVADVFVLCTRFEGQSISVLEAISAGLPVVATSVPGMDELVIHGQTGYLIEEDSPRSCVEAVSSILADPEKERLMSEAGYQRFEQYFNLKRQLVQTEELLWACGKKGFPKNYTFSIQPHVKGKLVLVKEEIIA